MKEVNHFHYYNIDKHEYKFAYDCAGLKCSNKATTILKVKYINKIGHFCQQCSVDILKSELAEKIVNGDSNA
jgi:hypothetical protein